jgi:hypothetical protein
MCESDARQIADARWLSGALRWASPMLLEDAHALVIGISKYQYMASLPPTQDAQDVAAVLRDPAFCAYPPERVHLLVDEQATREAIFARLAELAAATSEDSRVFVYFSGHGGVAAGPPPTYLLVPFDCRPKQRDLAISGEVLGTWLRKIKAAKMTIVLDCCHAAGLLEADLPLPSRPMASEAVGALARGRGRVVLAASREDSAATVVPHQRNSLFTEHLLRGLRGEAVGVGGVIRICDIYTFVQEHVAAYDRTQLTILKAEVEENYPVALLRGGRMEAWTLPPPPDNAAYDAFVTYCHDDDHDRIWTRQILVPLLERRGLRVCLEHRDFGLGIPRLRETERAIATSRYTVAVLTPAYLASKFDDYQGVVAAHAAITAAAPRFIPVLRRPCEIGLRDAWTSLVDVCRDGEAEAALERLAMMLRQPPTPRLST